MLDNGFTSGCLMVISNDFASNFESILKSVSKLAEKEWNKFDKDNNWKLNKSEKLLYDNKSNMPDSFVKKYYKKMMKDCPYILINHLPELLFHKKKPDTHSYLIDGLKKQQLYKVKDTKTNKIYFTDEYSITCVKWCIVSRPEDSPYVYHDQEADYTKSLYVWDQENKEVQIINNLLPTVENLSKPLTYYGGSNYYNLNISYISDIHLDEHLLLTPHKKINILINNIVKSLYESMNDTSVIVFAGDISSNPVITISFYEQFVKYKDYLFYKKIKNDLLYLKSLQLERNKLLTKINKLNLYIDTIKMSLQPYLDFSVLKSFKNKYPHNKNNWESTIKSFQKNKTNTALLSTKPNNLLSKLAKSLDFFNQFQEEYDSFLREYNQLKSELINIELSSKKEIDNITISDIYTEHILLSYEQLILVVLGNHEYIGFKSIKEAISFYRNHFEKLGIELLQNEDIESDDGKYIFFGGTGFAKYNSHYNATTLNCCDNFTRADEINETTLFENEYLSSKKYALSNHKCFICISHYPVTDCLNGKFDKEVIYFSGHTHHNEFIKNERKFLCADNQIGYKNQLIAFKTISIGCETNPYSELNDGLYKTSIEDYLQFYKYLGENIGGGKLLYERCKNGKSNLYILKRNGYYGFFLRMLDGYYQGISIMNGGKANKLTSSTDFSWICENFDIVLNKYLQALLPLRNIQNELSNELISLGLSGEIHGCIVDIDFYHHIIINTFNGTMTYYYSPVFGEIKPLSSFEEVLLSIKNNNKNIDYDLLLAKYKSQNNNPKYLLHINNEINLLETDFFCSIDSIDKTYSVSRSKGIYGVSRKINALQRLFDNHVLRDFNLSQTKTKPKSFRQYLYLNRKFYYEGNDYIIIEDDGGEFIKAAKILNYGIGRNKKTVLSKDLIQFSISDLKKKIHNKNDAFWLTCDKTKNDNI